MIKTVTAAGLSSNGKPYVSFDGDKTRYYVSSKIEPPALGAVIDAETSSKRFDGAKFDTWFLNSWKVPLVKTAAEVKQEIAVKNLPPSSQSQLQGLPVESKDCAIILQIIFKDVIHPLIDKGTISEPEEMAPWIERAYAYSNGFLTGKPVAFDDKFKIPPEMPGPSRDEQEEEFDENIPF